MNPTSVNPNDNQMPEMPTPVNPVINPSAVTMPNMAPGMVEMGMETMTTVASVPGAAQAMTQGAMQGMAQGVAQEAAQGFAMNIDTMSAQATTESSYQAPVNPMEPAMPSVTVTPVTPVENEAASTASPAVEKQAAQAVPTVQNPMTASTEGIRVGATDPITMPTPPKAPDPIEEELKAPMTAAAPVPGSIGSAISVPAGSVPVAGNAVFPETVAGSPNNVAFNDPAQAQAQPAGVAPAKSKSKMDKKTLILLCIVAGIVVVVLVAILIMTLAG